MKAIQTFRSAGRALAALLVSSCASHGQTLNTIYSFGHNDLGRQPLSGVIMGPLGELYGTTPFRVGKAAAFRMQWYTN